MRVKLEEVLRAKPLPRAHIVGPVPRPLTNDECVERLRRNGHTAANDPKHGLVVLYNGMVFRVAGGDFEHPSLLGVPGASANSIAWKAPKR